MLSAFIKKLLFTRQFFMNHGTIEIMKRKQILVSPSVLSMMQSVEHYDGIKEKTRQDFHEISNNFGSKRHELLGNIEDIFNIYGLGRLEIVDVDEKKKTAHLNLYNSALAHSASNGPVCHTTRGVLAGIFSFLFASDVDCEETKCFAADDEYCEFIIKEVDR